MSETKKSSRTKKQPSYASFRLTKRIKPPVNKKLSSTISLFKTTNRHIWRYKRVFFGIIIVYILLTALFVKGLSSTANISELRTELADNLQLNSLGVSAVLVGVAFGSGTTASTVEGSLYQTLIAIFISLALIWAFRQTKSNPKEAPGIRQSFYNSTGSMVAYITVLLVIGLQFIPMLVGISLYNIVQANGLAVTALENTVWIFLVILLSILSLYMISSSLFAVLIVTLPRMKPIRALKAARKVVAFRRWLVLRKILTFGLLVTVLFGALLFAIILVAPVITEWLVVVMSGYIFALGIGAIYTIYQELL